MSTFIVNLVNDFSKSPYGRETDLDGAASGENFRNEILTPALKNHTKVHVVLDGYNRYGRSFLDEAFGGLIRVDGFTPNYISENLSYSHSTVKSIELVITDRLKAATKFYYELNR